MANNSFKLYIGYPTVKSEEGEATFSVEKSLFSSFQNGVGLAPYSFDEKFQEKEFGQCTLTFSSMLYVNGERNPFINSLVIDRYIVLEKSNGQEIQFVITSIAPSHTSGNVKYTYTCQDALSFELTKIVPTISISTDDEDISGDFADGPKTIEELTTKILSLAHSYWTNSYLVKSNNYKFAVDELTLGSEDKTISYESESISPYQALTDVLKQFDALLQVDYKNRTLFYLPKNKMTFSGLYLRPETNVSSFNHSLKGDNLCNIFRVYGDEDADGNYVSIVPSIPSRLQDFFAEQENTENFWNFNKDEIYSQGQEDKTFEKAVRIAYEATNTKTDGYTASTEWTQYFQYLSLVPSGASILYNFDYWRDQGLISKDELDKIENRWTYFRKLNILHSCYYPKYLTYRYQVSKIDDKFDEYCAAIGADDQTRASLPADASTAISSRGLYCSSCISHFEEGENGKYSYVNYLPIGCVSQEIVGKCLHWGTGINGEKLTIPDFIYLQAYIEENEVTLYRRDGIGFAEQDEFILGDATDDLNILVSNPNASTSTDISNWVGMVYIKYDDDLINYLASNINDFNTANQDTITAAINSYQEQIDALLTPDYCGLKTALFDKDSSTYGNDTWIEEEIAELDAKIEAKREKQSTIVARLVDMTGTDSWRNADTIDKSNWSLYSEYCDLVKQYENIGYYIGGEGTKTDSTTGRGATYDGWYVIKRKRLKELQKSIEGDASYKNIAEIYGEVVTNSLKYQAELENWWNDWYADYGWLTRESIYEDSEQLTFKTLYSTASVQFESYRTPQASYSLNYIKSDWLEDSNAPIKVGTQVRLSHPGVKDVQKENYAEIRLSDSINNPAIVVLRIRDKNGDLENINIKNFSVIDGTKLVIKDSKLKQYWAGEENPCQIESVIINSLVYGLGYGDHRIESIEPVYEGQSVDLTITGISQDLRSDIYQLTVEEYSLYKVLVDRLLNLIK